ncbi:MAG: NUDIX domain-containing protein [Magnetovibrionaceae bacterium]
MNGDAMKMTYSEAEADILDRGAFERHDVAGLLVTSDGRYLMQLRDDNPALRVPGHWGLFGGGVEPGESAWEAIRRELDEELRFRDPEPRWFTENAFVLPQFGVASTLKTFFEVPVTESQIGYFVLGEGQDMALFTLAELMLLTKVVPWDLTGILLHARRRETFRYPEGPTS